MKVAMILMALFTANLIWATETTCHATNSFQTGSSMVSEVELRFDLTKKGNESEIKNVVGHVFVKSPFEDGTPHFSTIDSYMGFFKFDSLVASKDYSPRKYIGYARFDGFNAAETAGLESGMWGYLVLDVNSQDNVVKGAYIFQAGDHMGGTILIECRE